MECLTALCVHVINRLPDLRKNQQVRCQFIFFPHKIGVKTMVVDFDCSAFKNIKASSTVIVMP